MPILTFYAYIGKKNTRHAISSLEDLPTSYDFLKDKLLELAKTLYCEKQSTNTAISLEMHQSGKAITAGQINPTKLPQQASSLLVKPGSYQQTKIRFKRNTQFQCTLIYNHLNRKITVKNVHFGNPLYRYMLEDYQTEQGKKYKHPPLIPIAHKKLRGNLKAILSQPPENPPQNYQEKTQPPYTENPYNTTEPQGPYAETLTSIYTNNGIRTFKDEQFRKEQK
jgi:hypothetical protein